MLDKKAFDYLKDEIRLLDKRREVAFTDQIRLTKKYKNLCMNTGDFSENELLLLEKLDNYNRGVANALTCRYDYDTPSVEDRVNELKQVMDDIERLISLIEWE